jgi:hypothetical protein
MDVITLINTDSTARNILQYGVEGEDYIIDENGILSRKKNILNNEGEIISHGTYYMMDIKKTGNCFIAHPEEGKPADYWEDAKKQNNAAVIDPLLGFDFNLQLVTNGQKQLDNTNIDRVGLDTDGKLNDFDSSDLKTMILTDINALSAVKDMTGLEKFIKTDLSVVDVETDGVKTDKYLVELNQSPAGIAGLANALDGKPYMAVGNSKPTIDIGKLTNSNASSDDGKGPSPYQVYYSWLVQYKYLPAQTVVKK